MSTDLCRYGCIFNTNGGLSGDCRAPSQKDCHLNQRDAIKGLKFQLAQLRHAYTHLAAGTVVDQKQFADGLIAPAIRRLEEYIDAEDPD